MRPALAVFVKTPGASPVKTRLARDIGDAAALHFYRLAVKATAEIVAACSNVIDPYWAVAEEDSQAHPLWTDFPCVAQGNGTLGDRMCRVHGKLQAKHGTALMIGTDIPQISSGLILGAVSTLSKPVVDHVLGPANDGGFWLFGSKHPVHHESWCQVPYSTDRTAAALRTALADSGHLATVQTLTDIDSAADLEALHDALSRLEAPSRGQRELFAWVNEVVQPPATARQNP